MEKLSEGGGLFYRCVTIDSASDAAVMLVDALALEPAFLIDERRPAEYPKREREKILTFAEQSVSAWLAGTIAPFGIEKPAIPETLGKAGLPRAAYIKNDSRSNLTAFDM